MLEMTFDVDARTLYAYFAEIDEGQDATQDECPGRYLLDADGQITGMEVEIADILTVEELQWAMQQPEVRLDDDRKLRLTFAPVPVEATADFPYPAIVDRDAQGRALGIEFIADMDWGIQQRLRHLQPFIVEVFGEDEEEDEDGFSGPELQEEEQPRDAVAPSRTEEPPPAPVGSLLADEEVRTGFVALVGKPNVGKSTLLNAFLGSKVSIVSPKPQTTRIPVRGILNRPDAQVVFVDTPGLHDPKSRLGEYMVEAARRAIPDADVVCFVVDISSPPNELDRSIAESVKRSRKPSILVLNKLDVARRAETHLREFQELGPWEMEVALSAAKNEGLEGLLTEIIKRLPLGPRLFPAEQYTDLSEREQIAELVREKVLLNTQEEVPHGIAVEVEEWEERGDRLYIRATVNVEREGHKGIIIGDKGQMLKKIGSAARYEVERLLQRPVFLDLWIKVRKDWRSDPAALRWLGYDIKNLKK